MKGFVGYTLDGTIRNIMYCDEVGPTYEEDTGFMTVEIEGNVSLETHYVNSGTVAEKQLFNLALATSSIIANGADEAVISGIPAGAQVEWPDRQTDIVTDGEISFSVDLPGTYTFRFTDVPYLDKEITVEAIAAT